MMDRKKIVVIHPFRKFGWRSAVVTHLRKAYPENADKLINAIEHLLKVGPCGCHLFVRKLFDVVASDGEREFAVAFVDDLVAIVEIDRKQKSLVILAVINLCRLEVRVNKRLCNIADTYFDVNGEPLSLTIAVDPNNRLVCTRVWVTGEVRRIVLDLIAPRPPVKAAG